MPYIPNDEELDIQLAATRKEPQEQIEGSLTVDVYRDDGDIVIQSTIAGATAADIDIVIASHLHFDHAGNIERFAKARFHVQDAEVGFATGRCMCEPALRYPFDVEDVVTFVRHTYAERVRFHDGDARGYFDRGRRHEPGCARPDGQADPGRTRQGPGGHGLFAFDMLLRIYKDQRRPGTKGSPMVGVLGNGEDLGCMPDAAMVKSIH